MKSTVLNPFRGRDCMVPYSNQISDNEDLWFPYRPGEPVVEALYFPLPKEGDKCVFIREVWFYTRNSGEKASFRIRIFNADGFHKPSDDILTDNVIVEVNRIDELVKINLEKYHLNIPENGVYVGFELLIMPENKREIPFPDGSGAAEIYYPFLQYFPVGTDVDFSCQTYSGGVWKENKIPVSYSKKSEVYKPAISLVVESE